MSPTQIFNQYYCLLETKINDIDISQSVSMYNYKSYVMSLISYDDQAKSTNLFLTGWVTDDPESQDGLLSIEPTNTNESMLSRNALFRKNGVFNPKTAQKAEYSEEGFTFLAPLRHEFNGIRQLFPSNTKVAFHFIKADSAWYLMKPNNVQTKDTENYTFSIISCVIFVKICTLNENVYKSLSSRLSHEKILYHYRKLSMKTETINQHSILFESSNLFPDSESPMKIYFMIVKNSSLGKDYYSNPFSFIRSVKVYLTTY